MRKRLWALALVAALFLPVQAIRAEGGADVQTEHADEYEQVVSAFLAHKPGAVVDYAVRQRDDGRVEWDLFFALDGQYGECEMVGADFEVRSLVLRDMPEGALTASQAAAALADAKGDLRIVELELDADRGSVRYEGEAVMGEKRYEFEMDVFGGIIEWKRD